MTSPLPPSEAEGGEVIAIYVAPAAAAPPRAVGEAALVAGRGIVGDRYGEGVGTFSHNTADHELTLIEAEVIEEIARAHGVFLTAGESRRNLTTRGVRLNDLVGKRFRIGGVLCEGTRRCEPCAHLERVAQKSGLARLLAGQGGLRALVLEDGAIRVGDAITLSPHPQPLPRRGGGELTHEQLR